MDPVPAIRVRLLLRQSCLKDLPDPAGFDRCRRVAINWESRQPRRRGDHVFQRVGIMTRRYWYVLRRGRVHPGRSHHLGLNWRSSPGHYDLWRFTRPCTRRVEEVSRIVNRWEWRLSLLMPPSHDLIGCVLIHREPERLRLDKLSLGVQSRPFCSHPDSFRCQIFLGLRYIQL